MNLPHGTATVLVIGLGVLGLYGMGRISEAVDSANESITHGSEAVLAARDGVQKRISALQDTTKALRNSANRLRVIADTADNRLAAALKRLNEAHSDTARASAIVAVDSAANEATNARKAECEERDKALSACQEAQLVMQNRIDTLETHLHLQIRASQCKIVVFNCPRWTTAALIGAVVGATIHATLVK